MSKETKSAGIKADVYIRVTERILADLAQGVRPWMNQIGRAHV